MATLLWILVTTITGALGWWLGSLVGGIMTSMILSVVATAWGAWWARKFVRDHL